MLYALYIYTYTLGGGGSRKPTLWLWVEWYRSHITPPPPKEVLGVQDVGLAEIYDSLLREFVIVWSRKVSNVSWGSATGTGTLPFQNSLRWSGRYFSVGGGNHFLCHVEGWETPFSRWRGVRYDQRYYWGVAHILLIDSVNQPSKSTTATVVKSVNQVVSIAHYIKFACYWLVNIYHFNLADICINTF